MEMNNVLRKDRDNFTIVQNEILLDVELSLAAKGMYAFMRSKPDNWNFTIRSMCKQLKEGQTAIGNALRELRAKGWINYKKHQDGSGEYFIHNAPTFFPKPENPNVENPNVGIPMLGKPKRISNTDLHSKTDLSNTDLVRTVESAFDLFWLAGMRKMGKKDAYKSFIKALAKSKMEPMAFAEMLKKDISERLANQQRGFDGLHPTTYLNQQRWEDEKVNDAKPEAKGGFDNWYMSDQGIIRKAQEMGVQPRQSESYRDLADRLKTMLASGAPANVNAQPVAPTVEDLIKDSDIPF